ncbi:hypothetical protein [Rufibacter tibetensis]|uniref:STAS/SEC14 domain-containing protein n=1 Tax=Rufibacter tibetensis TaxID=512763 RepID=A0A0P0C9E5_9BACT|nr:hypothetical protein [Rufibacter tibetensis]ALJ00200.1 hypothetical protein DC20_16040 [Rufibacter tibetensis]
MVLFESPFATLEHDTGLNLLKVTYRDRRGYRLADVADLMRHVGECATAYGVKSLFLDSSKSFNPMPEEEAEAASRHIAETCQTSGIERIARVGSPSLISEWKVREGINRVHQREPFRFALQTFTTKAEAMGWLAHS